MAQPFTFPETSKLATNTHHVALGTHHPSWRKMPDCHCQGKARAESGTCVWKFLCRTVSDKLGEQHMTLYTAEITELGSVEGDQESRVQVPARKLSLPFWASLFSPTKLKDYTKLSPSCLPPHILLFHMGCFYFTKQVQGGQLILVKS